MSAEIRCVVLDIDDTLYLERDYAASGFAAVAAHLDCPEFGPAACAALERGVRGRIFNEVLTQLGLKPPSGGIGELVRVYREHKPTIALLEDARTAIEEWSERGLLAAITDGPLASQQAKAHALGLAQWCRPIVFTAELGEGRGKPHPAAYIKVETVLGLRPDQCVYIADNPSKDFITPNERGWTTLRVRRPRSLHEAEASGSDVQWEVTSLASLPSALQEVLP
jgi:putative hydrolase of the HAD superfamily